MKILRLLLVLSIVVFDASAQEDLHIKAQEIAIKATLELNAGNVNIADSLIRTSINIYPSVGVINYLQAMAQLPDIAGANMVMALLKNKINSMPDQMIIAPDDNIWKSDPKPLLQEKSRGLFNYLEWCYMINRAYAGRSYIISTLNALQEPVIQKKEGKEGKHYDDAYNKQEGYKYVAARFKQNYSLVNEIINSWKGRTKSKEFFKLKMLFEQAEYQQAMELYSSDMESSIYSNYWLYRLYTRLGDQRALEILKKREEERKKPTVPPSRADFGPDYNLTNETYYDLALFYLKTEDYNQAINNLDKSGSLRIRSQVYSVEDFILLWDLYKAYGDAYTGLKQFSKAKDYFNLSLLYYPENDKVIKALAAMEQMAARETSLDKTAPTIVLTEPAPSRGIKVVAAGANFMVKGTATDISGIKEVLVNGVKMFVMPSGEFWGDVPMKEGSNSLKVHGTDLAGNMGEKIFDVQVTLTATPSTEIVAVTEQPGNNYCLLIAAQNYDDSAIQSLNNPIGDAIKLKLVLKEQYNFLQENIISLFNPSSNDIRRQLLEISTKLKPEDNLLIFYAGHGIWVEKEEKGYWFMTDAVYSNPATWLPNKEVLELIAKIPSRHTLLITDACFSGSVFKTRGIPANAPANILALNEKISRTAITSGNDSEVPDESVFMKYLLKALAENKENYLSAQKMFITRIIEAVMTETKTEPRYGTLELAGHVGGDFIFSKK